MAEPTPLSAPAPEPTLPPEEFSPEAIRGSYLALFYSALFHPVRTFRSIGEEGQPGSRLLFYALISVVLISTIAPIVHMANLGGNPAGLVVSMPFSAVKGVIIWVFVALVVSLLSYTFTGKAHLRTFLVLSGLATLPWLFMGPISLLKIGIGVPGFILNAALGLMVWLWTVLLFALAIIHSFHISAERVMLLLVMPFISFIVFLGWVIGFIGNIRLLTPP